MGPLVLDASAVYGALTGEPSTRDMDSLLRQRPAPSISASNLAEVIDKLIRVGGARPDDVRERINLLLAGGLEVEPVWVPIARSAGGLRATHYDRTDAPVSMSDCICLATALQLNAGVATTDGALARTARLIGVEVIALPNSQGERP